MSFNFVIPEFNIGGTGTPTFQFYKRGFELNGGGESPSWQDIILSGTTALTLVNSKADGLNYLKLFGGTEQRNLPEGYTQYEYLRSDGTQYIDLGYKGNGNTKVRIKARYYTETSNSGSGRVFGSRITAQSDAFAIGSASGTASTSSKITFFFGNQSYLVTDKALVLNEWLDIVFDKTTHNINGVDYSYPYNDETFETPENFKLFGFDNNGSMGIGYLDIALCQLWEDGVLVRDVVPAGYGTTYSMYDRVSGTMLPNAGTDNFIAGPEAVPTPDTPINIVSNNGTIKYGFNYYSYNVTRQLSVENYPVELDRSISYSDGVLTCGITGSVSSNRGIYPTWDMHFTGGHKYACVIMAKGDSRINLGLASIIPSGSVTGGTSLDGFYTLTSNYVWYAKLWECNTDSSARLNIRVAGTDVGQYASFKDILVIDLTAIFGAGNEPTTSSDIIQSTVKIYTDGTTETVEVDTTGDTATAEMLLKVGDYQDVQSILDGEVTRNVGIKVMTGDETFQSGTNGWISENTITNNLKDIYTPICTHFRGTDETPTANSNTVRVYYTSQNIPRVYFGVDKTIYTSAEVFKQFLADQYNAGNPVIIIYPLATATTETVTAQPLTIQAGTNIVEITQASINNLGLEVSYKGKV